MGDSEVKKGTSKETEKEKEKDEESKVEIEEKKEKDEEPKGEDRLAELTKLFETKLNELNRKVDNMNDLSSKFVESGGIIRENGQTTKPDNEDNEPDYVPLDQLDYKL
jgi:hypothetical protein